MATGANMYAGLVGSNTLTLGKHPDKFNFTNINDAFDNCKPGDTLLIESGTYSLSEIVTVNYNLEVIGMGRVVINGGTLGLENRLFMLNLPATGTSLITRITFRNIVFTNAYSAADCIEIDTDGGATTGTLKWKFFDCGFEATSGLALDVDQTTSTCPMYGLVQGYYSKDLYLDDCNFALSAADSEITVQGYDLYDDQTFVLGTDNVAAIYNWNDIVYSNAAVCTGGAASIIVNVRNSAKISAGAIAAPVVEDWDQTCASENIQIGTLDT